MEDETRSETNNGKITGLTGFYIQIYTLNCEYGDLAVSRTYIKSSIRGWFLYDPHVYQSWYFMAILLFMQFDAKEYDSKF